MNYDVSNKIDRAMDWLKKRIKTMSEEKYQYQEVIELEKVID